MWTFYEVKMKTDFKFSKGLFYKDQLKIDQIATETLLKDDPTGELEKLLNEAVQTSKEFIIDMPLFQKTNNNYGRGAGCKPISMFKM